MCKKQAQNLETLKKKKKNPISFLPYVICALVIYLCMLSLYYVKLPFIRINHAIKHNNLVAGSEYSNFKIVRG